MVASSSRSQRRYLCALLAAGVTFIALKPRATVLVPLQAICGNWQQLLANEESALFAAIDSKFDFINEYTLVAHPDYKRGYWGIANKVNGSSSNYGTKKTRFVFDKLRAHDKSERAGGRPGVKTICELGFNAGHSAVLLLDSVPDARLIEFDLGDVKWSARNSELLTRIYGSDRFTYVKGDSAVTVSEFMVREPETQCDVVFIDGAKGEPARRADVERFEAMAHPGTLLFGDEANTVECVSGRVPRTHPLCKSVYHGTELAWNALVREGVLRYIECSKRPLKNDLVCLWQYTFHRNQ